MLHFEAELELHLHLEAVSVPLYLCFSLSPLISPPLFAKFPFKQQLETKLAAFNRNRVEKRRVY